MRFNVDRQRKAKEIKVTEEKSVPSVAESVPKHETVHEVTFDRTAAAPQDAHRVR